MLREDFFDLAGVWKTPDHLLREQGLSVQTDFEDAALALDELGFEAEASFYAVRQTGGSREVVSNDAVFDRQLVTHEFSFRPHTAPAKNRG